MRAKSAASAARRNKHMLVSGNTDPSNTDPSNVDAASLMRNTRPKHGKRSKTASGGSTNLWNKPAMLPYSLAVTTGDARWSR